MNIMNGFRNTTLSMICLAFVLVSGCAKQDDTYRQFLDKGEIVYVGKADSVQVFPGKNRLKLSWLILADPNVSKAKVFWNNHSDSLEKTEEHTSELQSLMRISYAVFCLKK